MASLERLGRVFGVLDDATRRRVYRAVVDRGSRSSRDDVAGDLGISRTLAAFHLDKLADRGLLTVSYARPAGRGGPGAGRPAKLYERSDLEIDGSLPERRYDLAGQILATAIAAPESGETPRDAALRVARERGVEVGAQWRESARRPRGARATTAAACAVLADLGFEPAEQDGAVVLRNCPFHAVVDVAADLVCAVNECLVGGVLDGVGGEGVSAALDPGADRCCVVLRRSRSAG